MLPALSTIDQPVRSMSACPEFHISIHSPSGQVPLSARENGLAITSVILRSDGTVPAEAMFAEPGVGVLVDIKSDVGLLLSSSKLTPEDEVFHDA